MVPIENRATFWARIKESQKLTAFNNLLLGMPYASPFNSDCNETDEICFGIVNAIYSNDKSTFEAHYFKKRRSNPTRNSPSPFINDDFLIFCLIVGIIRFNEDKDWINNIVSLRNKSHITITFENLLKENYFSRDNAPEIVLIFFQLTNQSLIDDSFLNTTYRSIKSNRALFEDRSDFFIICSIRAYDLIIERKEAPDGNEIDLLKKFQAKFLKRIKLFSWIVQSIVLLILLYVCFELLSKYPSVKQFVDQFNATIKLLGLFGLSQVGNLSSFLKRKSNEFLLKLFGYPTNLIDKKL